MRFHDVSASSFAHRKTSSVQGEPAAFPLAGTALAPGIFRVSQGVPESFLVQDWQARVSEAPSGLTDYMSRPCLLLRSERSMVEPLRRPALVERP
jgi:hypothetical protein